MLDTCAGPPPEGAGPRILSLVSDRVVKSATLLAEAIADPARRLAARGVALWALAAMGERDQALAAATQLARDAGQGGWWSKEAGPSRAPGAEDPRIAAHAEAMTGIAVARIRLGDRSLGERAFTSSREVLERELGRVRAAGSLPFETTTAARRWCGARRAAPGLEPGRDTEDAWRLLEATGALGSPAFLLEERELLAGFGLLERALGPLDAAGFDPRGPLDQDALERVKMLATLGALESERADGWVTNLVRREVSGLEELAAQVKAIEALAPALGVRGRALVERWVEVTPEARSAWLAAAVGDGAPLPEVVRAVEACWAPEIALGVEGDPDLGEAARAAGVAGLIERALPGRSPAERLALLELGLSLAYEARFADPRSALVRAVASGATDIPGAERILDELVGLAVGLLERRVLPACWAAIDCAHALVRLGRRGKPLIPKLADPLVRSLDEASDEDAAPLAATIACCAYAAATLGDAERERSLDAYGFARLGRLGAEGLSWATDSLRPREGPDREAHAHRLLELARTMEPGEDEHERAFLDLRRELALRKGVRLVLPELPA